MNWFVKAATWVKVVLIVIIALILIIVTVKIVQALRKPPNAQYISDGGAIPQGWTPTAITDELYNAFAGAGITGKSAAVKMFNALNDNQRIAVYNDWNKRYSGKSVFMGFGTYGSLSKMLGDEWFLWGDDMTEARIMLDHLKRLQLP